jgi:hypothetical protein
MPFAVLLLGLVVGALALLLALNTASAANELDRHKAASADAQLSAQLIELQNRIAASAAPANIARVATDLGMVPAGNPAFLRQGEDGHYVVLGSPAPASAPPLPVPAKKKTPKPSTTPTTTPPRTPATSPAKSTGTPSGAATRAGGTTPAKPTTTRPTTTRPTTTPPAAPTPTPTPTPNPTISLPGGAR